MVKLYKTLAFVSFVLFISGMACGGIIDAHLSFDPYRIEITALDDCSKIRYRDMNAFSLAKEGDPDLPYFMVKVLIPENSSVSGISVSEEKMLSLGKLMPCPFQGYEIISRPAGHIVKPNEKTYKAGGIYPSERLIINTVGKARGFSILYFSYCPFEYNTLTGELFMYQDAVFSIDYNFEESPGNFYPGNDIFNRLIGEMVRNPADIKAFYPHKTDLSPRATDYDMLIITTDSLKPAAETYASFRASSGVNSIIKTVSEINSAYPGSTIQLKIKNCTFQHVQESNIAYVLLIGDGGDNSSYSVPDQNTYVYLDWAGESDNTIPCDLFYACFDGQFDWNADGDSRVGEMGVDNADIVPDVIIGRISVRTQQQILDYINKVEAYAGSINHPEFAENLLLSGVTLWSSGDAKIKSEKMYNEYIAPYWPNHNKYTLYDSDTAVSVATLSALFNQGMNLFHMATHGNVTVWGMSSGGDFTSASALALNNTPGIVSTIACITNAFDPEVSGASDPCLGEAFIRNPDGGSVVYIGASRYGIGYTTPSDHGPSFQYSDWIFRHTLEDTYQHLIGYAFNQAKTQLAGTAETDCSFRWIQFSLNFLGDPSITAHTSVLIEGPYPAYASHFIDDSIGNNNGVPNIGETFDIYISLKNLGNQTALNVNGTLSSSSEYAEIISQNSSYPSIPAGQTAQNSTPYRIKISANCPHGTEIPINLDWTCLMGSGSFGITLRITSENIISIGDGTSVINYAPLYTYYHDNRTQIIYLSSEFGAGSKTLEGLSIDIAGLPGMALNNWTIRLKHTAKQNFDTGAVFENTGWTIVYQANENISQTGWKHFVFSQPFEYNGTDNLMVDLSFNNSSWTYEYGKCLWTNAPNKRAIYAYSDSYNGDPLNWTSGSGAPSINSTSNFLNIEFAVTSGNIPDGVVLDYFSASASGSSANIAWGTLSEVGLLGWNLYRQRAKKVNPFISYAPVRLNTGLIPAQGGLSESHDYQYADTIIGGEQYFYILEAVFAGGEAETWKIRMQYN